MQFKLKTEVLGFSTLKEVHFKKENDIFSVLKDIEHTNIAFTLVNPFVLIKDYSFELSIALQTLLEINEKSNIEIYCTVLRQNPANRSKVNFLAPYVLNYDNNTCAQVILRSNEYPQFGYAEELKTFISS